MKKLIFVNVRLLAAAVVTVGALVISAPTAEAAASAPVLRSTDTTSFPHVKLTVLRPPVASRTEEIKVTENGKTISGATSETPESAGLGVGVVLVLDTSSAMKDGDAIVKAKSAAIDMVRSKAPNEKFAIVATNNEARPVVNFTSDPQLLIDSINNVSASGDNALWKGAQVAAGLLTAAPDLQPNVVIVSGTPDSLSPAGTFTSAQAQLRSAKAVVFSVAVRQRQAVNVANLQALSATTGGRYIETADPDALSQILTGIESNLASQAVITYRSLPSSKVLDISVTVGNATAVAHTSPGTISEGAAVNPSVEAKSPIPKILQGTLGLMMIAGLSLLGVGILVYGIVEIILKDRKELSKALRPYSDEDESDHLDFSKLADSAFIKRAVAETAKLAEERGLLVKVRTRLEQADLPLKPAEALFFTAVSAVVAMLIGAALFGILGLFFAGFTFAFLPVAITGFLAGHRKRKFTSQLPDTLQLLSGSLRAGYSLMQGLDAVAKQSDAPMGSELQRAMSEARLGRPVELALQDISDRMVSEDFEWAVMAIKIQREVGGNLAELLMTVSETMIQRERLRREVRALTAEGRISAIVLSVLPPAIGGIIALMNPAYMQPLLSQFLGQVALAGAGVMIVVGYLTMNKMTQIEA